MRVRSGGGQRGAAFKPTDATAGYPENAEHTEGTVTLIQLQIAGHACAWTSHLAPGQIRASEHPGYSKRPR